MKKTETRDKLVQAFFTLYSEKSIDKISIKAVTELAGYHRSTFYEYFVDIYDLLEQEEEEILRLQKELFMTPIFTGKIDAFAATLLFEPSVQMFKLKGDKLAILIGTNGDPAFRRKLQERIKETLQCLMARSEDVLVAEYLSEFLSAGILAVVHKAWMDQAVSVESLAAGLQPIIFSLLREA